MFNNKWLLTVPCLIIITQQCQNFEGLDQCAYDNQNRYNDPSIHRRRFQTPNRQDPQWHPSYQDYSQLTGYISLQYIDGTRRSALLRIHLNNKNNESFYEIFYNNELFVDGQMERRISAGDSLGAGPLQVTVVDRNTGARLSFEPMDFFWNVPSVRSPYGFDGTKGAIVELFGWSFDDIAEECAFLGQSGYLGVRIWPPNGNGEVNPWWVVYQPVSYKLHSRSGTRDQLRRTIHQCRQHGVRVYADAVINHMTGSGNDIVFHRNEQQNPDGTNICTTWGPKNGSAGSPFFTHGFIYTYHPTTNERYGLEFPAVPYTMEDFHCERKIRDWSSPRDLNFGWLASLSDLATEADTVRERIATFLVDMLSIGISGFRIDAAKHMAPDDIAAIIGLVHKKMGGRLPNDFLVWLEVIINETSKPWLACELSQYNYFEYLTRLLYQQGLSEDEVDSIKLWAVDYPLNHPMCGHWVLPPSRFVIQNDDHDQQAGKKGLRPLGDKGSVLVLDKNVTRHRYFEVQLFTQQSFPSPIRLILSSYTHGMNGALGFPDGQSDCSQYTGPDGRWCNGMKYQKAYDPLSCGYSCVGETGEWLMGVYTRVHRDQSIIRAMREWMGLEPLPDAEHCKQP